MADYRSEEAKAWRKLYKTAKWRRLRELHLSVSPLCVYCAVSHDITAADVVDHIKPHRGDIRLFSDPNNLQSLCHTCHSSIKQKEENGRFVIRYNAAGWPI